MVITAGTSTAVIIHGTASCKRQGQSIAIIGGSGDILSVNDTRTAERSGLQHTHNHAGSALTGTGLLCIVYRTGQVERQSGSLAHIQVEVSTIVETLIAVVIMKIIKFGKQTTLCHETGRNKVAHGLGTTADVDIMLGLHGNIFHDVIDPTHTRKADGVAAVLEFLKHSIREHRSERLTAREVKVIPLHLVEESPVFITVCLL